MPKSMDRSADGYGKLILPLDKPSWQASMDGAAADFIKRETETWSNAHPSDQKEVKRFHNRDRRIIPDGQPLREA